MIEGLEPYPKMKDSRVPWLGWVPEHWETMRGKNIFRSVDIRSTSGKEELLTVSSSRGVVPRASVSVTMFKAESYVGYKLCWPDDLVINSLWAWGGGLGISRYHGIVSTAYGVYRLQRKYARYAKYFHSLLRSHAFNYELRLRSKGIWISRLQLTDESFLEAALPIPPDSEQALAVRFLAYADHRIRRLIRSKQKLITLLEEQKQTIIHHAVTRGLDPNVRLKPSGVSWLGDIPEHWEVRRSKRLFAPRKELARPGDIQLAATQAFGVIAQDDYEQKVGRKIVKIFRHLEKRRHVEVDDFVISMRSFQGGLERAWQSGCIRSSYVVLRPLVAIDVGYFSRLFKSPGYIRALQSTADFIRDGQDLNYDNFCSVDIAFPPVGEQRAISQMLDTALSRTAALTTRTDEEILLLKEFRTRLISDAITGKIDVREAAARLPADDLEANDLPDDADTDGEEEDEQDSTVESGAEDGDDG